MMADLCELYFTIRGMLRSKYPTSNTQVANLIAAIGDGTYSVSEMMEKLQLNNRRYFTKEYLKIAVMEGVVEPLYLDQLKHPRQKYRLTDRGKRLLTQ